MDRQEFYEKVSTLLEVDQEYIDLRPRRPGRDSRYTRWGPRIPGNGRFKGIGVIRNFGGVIHAEMPGIGFRGTWDSPEESLKALEKFLRPHEERSDGWIRV